MLLPIDKQIYYFLCTITAGIITGLLFDVYRIMTKFNSKRKFICGISDMLFCILSAILIFIFFLLTNNGNMGYYTFVGIPIGLIFYFIILSRICTRFLKWIIYFTGSLIRLIIYLIILPLRIIVYFIRNLIYHMKKSVLNKIYFKKTGLNKIKKKEKRNT